MTQDYVPALCIVVLGLLSVLATRFSRATAMMLVAIFASAQLRSLHSLQTASSTDGKIAAMRAETGDGKPTRKQARDPAASTPNESRVRNVAPAPKTYRDVEAKRQAQLDAHMERFKMHHHPPRHVLNRELHYAFVDLDRRGSKKDVYTVVEGSMDDECTRLATSDADAEPTPSGNEPPPT